MVTQLQADAKSAVSAGDARARAGTRAGAAESTHLKKFGKLLATFGTRMACLLRHLGPECHAGDRRKAYRLFAEASRKSPIYSRQYRSILCIRTGVYMLRDHYF